MEVRVSVAPALHTNIVCKGSEVVGNFTVDLDDILIKGLTFQDPTQGLRTSYLNLRTRDQIIMAHVT